MWFKGVDDDMTTKGEYISTDEIERWCITPKCKHHKIIHCRNGRDLDYCKSYKTFCFNAIISCRQYKQIEINKGRQTKIISEV